MPFPLIKIGAILIRQISRPLANQLKETSKRNVFLKRYVVMPVAQIYHKGDMYLRMISLGFQAPRKVAPLNDEMAIELGSDMLSEIFLLSVAMGLVIFEYNRSTASYQKKEDQLNATIAEMKSNIEALLVQSEQNSAQLRVMERNFAHIHSSSIDRGKNK